MLLAEGAADPDRVAVNRTGDLARHELTLMESADVAPLLRQVQRVVRRPNALLLAEPMQVRRLVVGKLAWRNGDLLVR